MTADSQPGAQTGGALAGRPFALIVLRSLARVPLLIHEANVQCRLAKQAFHDAVTPLIDAAVPEPNAAGALANQLLPWAVKGTVLLDRYAVLTGTPPDSRLAVLAASFTRLYDDLLDEAADDSVAGRIGALLGGGRFDARSDLERVLAAVFGELSRRADRPRHDAAYVALDRLHELQLDSLHQAGGDLTAEQTWQLSLDKGGSGTVVLGCLVRPAASAAERSALFDLGGLLQLIDDWEDEATDRAHGLQTTATTCGLGLAAILRQARLVESRLTALYGSGPAVRFMDGIYCWICVTWAARLLGRTRSPSPHARPFPRLMPLRVLIQHEEVLR